MDDRRREIQAQQYAFPYHYLPTLDEQGTISLHKFVYWGLDYLTYMTFVCDVISQHVCPASLLDIGCGDGRLLHMLSRQATQPDSRAISLAGVDTDEQAIAFARAFNPGIPFYIGSLERVPGFYEAACLVEVLEHIPDDGIPALIESVAGKLLPGGSLVVSSPTQNLALNRKHFRHYRLETLQAQLAPTFTIKQHWYLTRQGISFRLLEAGLQNVFGIVLWRKWRRLIWRLHRKYTFHATSRDGRHLVALAQKTG